MVFKAITKMFGGREKDDESREIIVRALNHHGLEEYRETTMEVERIKAAIEAAPTRMQKRENEELLNRYRCRQNALRSAAVVLASRLDIAESPKIYQDFAITDPRQCPAHELARYFIEEAQNDFIMGRA